MNKSLDNKKISLGIKQLSQDPWETIEDEYKVGQLIDGEISKITNFGMFIRLTGGIEGLVHISELNAEKKGEEKIEDLFKVGEKHQFRVIKVSKDERKLGLSTKLTGEMREERKAAPKAATPASAPKESSYKKQQKTTSDDKKPSSAKSQFQLELEKHAARSDDNKGE